MIPMRLKLRHPEMEATVHRKINLAVCVYEDVVPVEYAEDFDLCRAWATPAMMTWWSTAMERLVQTERFTRPALNEGMVRDDTPSELTILLMLCSRDSMDALCDEEDVLGCHLISTPDEDPFNDGTPLSNGYRVLMVSDREEFLSHIADLARADIDDATNGALYIEAWLNTAFHEISHALLFAENAAFMSPHNVELLSDAGEADHDVFDCSTGYGIRPLKIYGHDIWADNVEDAHVYMEAFVEGQGRAMISEVLTGEMDPRSFLAAADVISEFEEAIRDVEERDLGHP